MTRLGRGTLSTAVDDLAGMQPAWIVAAASLLRAWPPRFGGRLAGRSARVRRQRRLHSDLCSLRDWLARQLGRAGAPRRSAPARTALAHASRERSALAHRRHRRFRRRGPHARPRCADHPGGVGRPDPGLACTLACPWRRSSFSASAHVSAPGRPAGSAACSRFSARSGARRVRGAALFGWIALSCVARIAAAVAIAMALGVPHPIWVAVVLLAAMALAGLLPLTPGNFGAGAGAATLALHGTGVGLGVSLALGVAFQAVETFAGVTLGLAGAAVLAAPGTAGPGAGRWPLPRRRPSWLRRRSASRRSTSSELP